MSTALERYDAVMESGRVVVWPGLVHQLARDLREAEGERDALVARVRAHVGSLSHALHCSIGFGFECDCWQKHLLALLAATGEASA